MHSLFNSIKVKKATKPTTGQHALSQASQNLWTTNVSSTFSDMQFSSQCKIDWK